MEAVTIQMEIARIRIDERLADADRARRARNVHSLRRPRPGRPTSAV
jgi:hypothetical protein